MDRKKYCSYYFKILDIKKLIIYTEQKMFIIKIFNSVHL